MLPYSIYYPQGNPSAVSACTHPLFPPTLSGITNLIGYYYCNGCSDGCNELWMIVDRVEQILASMTASTLLIMHGSELIVKQIKGGRCTHLKR